MMPAVQTLLSGDVHQLQNTGKWNTNAITRYVCPLLYAKGNTHPNHKTSVTEIEDQYAGLAAPFFLSVSKSEAGFQPAILHSSLINKHKRCY